MYAELSLDNDILQDLIEKNLSAAERRNLVAFAVDNHSTSERLACCLNSIIHSVYRYQARKTDDSTILEQLGALAKGHCH